MTETFQQRGRHPRSVIVLCVQELYFQCAKAVMRSGLWSRDDASGLPTAGDFLTEVDRSFDGKTYDLTYEEAAQDRMW